MKRMIRTCSKCNFGDMEAETQPIPKEIPLPILGALKLQVQNYLPYIMRKYNYYTVFICTLCGNMEVYLS
jgi:hypothetical protein